MSFLSSLAKSMDDGSQAIVLTLADDYSGGMTRDELGKNSLYHLLELDRRGFLEVSEVREDEPVTYTLSPLGKELATRIEQVQAASQHVTEQAKTLVSSSQVDELQALFEL